MYVCAHTHLNEAVNASATHTHVPGELIGLLCEVSDLAALLTNGFISALSRAWSPSPMLLMGACSQVTLPPATCLVLFPVLVGDKS
jgi:hypothetical protein